MKLVVQIPCYNEEATLEKTIAGIPETIKGIDVIEIIVINDGSTDSTLKKAEEHFRVAEVVNLHSRRGLAGAFMAGIHKALSRNANIIVNTDGDNQYRGDDITNLVMPILDDNADVVIGDRQVAIIRHFSKTKKWLQKTGSAFVRWISGADVTDATSGFRAFSRDSALHLQVFSKYSYTLETILQLSIMHFKIASVKVRTNRKERESHLMKSVPEYIIKSIKTLLLLSYIYNPQKLFKPLSQVFGLPGLFLIVRFFYFYFTNLGPTGHVQSLIIGIALLLSSFFFIIVGLIADLISTNRKILESIHYEIRKQNMKDIG